MLLQNQICILVNKGKHYILDCNRKCMKSSEKNSNQLCMISVDHKHIHSWKSNQVPCQLLWTSWSSSQLLLLLTSPSLVPSDNWDKAGPTLVFSSPPPMECRIFESCSLGRFQDGRVAIKRMRAPKTTRMSPRMFTKTASGGESLYLGLLLSIDKTKVTCLHFFCTLTFNN